VVTGLESIWVFSAVQGLVSSSVWLLADIAVLMVHSSAGFRGHRSFGGCAAAFSLTTNTEKSLPKKICGFDLSTAYRGQSTHAHCDCKMVAQDHGLRFPSSPEPGPKGGILEADDGLSEY
jgi:hypothetical protein